MPNKSLKDHLWLAIGFASINAFMLAGMSLFSKLLSQYLGPIEVTFFRNAFSFIALFVFLILAGKLALLKTQRPFAHLFRSVFGTVGIMLGMFTLSIMPIAETTILLFTAPLFVVLLSYPILKEPIGPYRLAAALFGFLGVIVLALPGNNAEPLPLLGLATGLGWGFMAGGVDIILRWIGRTENATATTFYFVLIGSILCALHWPFAEIKDTSFSLNSWMIIAGLGITGLLALLAKTQSFRLGEAALISPFMYTMIIWAVLFDYLFWDKTPTWNVLTGGGIIIGANIFILYREYRKKQLNSE